MKSSFTTLDEFLKVQRTYLVQGGAVVPHTNWYPLYGITHSLARLASGFEFEFHTTFYNDQGDRGNWVFDEEELWRKGTALLRRPAILKKLYRIWQREETAFYAHIAAMTTRKLAGNLIAEYRKFSKRYLSEYTPALITEHFTVWGNRFGRELLERCTKYSRAAEDIAVLTLLSRRSFMQDEELDLLRIAELMIDQGRATSKVRRAIVKHRENYFWIQNNYKRTVPLSVQYFQTRVREILKTKTHEEIRTRIDELQNYEGRLVLEKRHTRSITKLRKKDVERLEWLAFIASWHDRRKRANLIANHYLNLFLAHGARILHVPLLYCQFLYPEEFLSAVAQRKFPTRMVAARLKGMADMFLPDGAPHVWTGKAYKKAYRVMIAASPHTATDIIKGLGVSPGRVQGVVRTIANPGVEAKSFRKGEILVSYMTRPDFLPLMKHAAAIVADEGGVTSHAAIVARELKIPCVVGCRIAMRVLKDGDKVEVDATKGVVRKL